ncbi:MAG: signal peptidase I [Candidatus Limnocylindria bacterium]
MTYVPDDTDSDGAPATSERAGSRRALGCAFEIVETLVLTLLIYLVIHNFVAQPFEVQQSSMVPTIVDGEYILIDKLTPRFGGYEYGDVVVFNPPAGSGLDAQGIPFIKRIIGMPGDTVSLENGRVFVTREDASPVRIEEPYVLQGGDGSTAATTCPRPDCPLTWIVGDNEYFVMGDNRPSSQDSRVFGPVDQDTILGRAWLRYFPLERIGLIERPDYPALAIETTAGDR